MAGEVRPGSLVPYLLDAVSSLVVVADAESGNILDLNAAVERVTGTGLTAVVGRPLWEVLAVQAGQEQFRAFFRAIADGSPRPHSSTVRSATGAVRRVTWSGSRPPQASAGGAVVVMTGVDVSDEHRTEAAFSHLLGAASATAFIGTDLSGTVTFCSSGAEQMLGRAAHELVGRVFPISFFDPEQLRAQAVITGLPVDLGLLSRGPRDRRVERRTRRVDLRELDRRGQVAPPATAGHSSASEWTIRRDDGARLTVALSVSLMKDAFGVPVGYLGIGHDVTEQRDTNTLLVAALRKEGEVVERLRELDEAKSDFVATVSHELRTPLTSIAGYAELLQDGAGGDLSPQQTEFVDAITRSTGRLKTLTNDLLLLSAFESRTLVSERVDVDLRSVVARAQQVLRSMTTGRDLQLIFEVPDVPVTVAGDPEHLERVVLNLMSNAIKFTEDGGSVTCRVSLDSGDALVEVVDTGIGIPSVEQEALFTKFFRGSTARRRAIQGTGLGLAIVASIVDGHEGEVSVESAHLDGATFRVRLPLA